jgi:DNA-binding transcriptional MocR family regulator
MAEWSTLDAPALAGRVQELEKRYNALREKHLALDMTRGKPCAEQLDLANGLLTVLGPEDYRAADGTDCRNYGGVDGLPEAKALGAAYLGVEPEDVIIGGNSSLALMHDTVLRALLLGVPGGDGPWVRQEAVRFLCPAPGYDRHFAICEHFGIEMLPVPMTATGPAMDEVEAIAARDPAVKGIWCVPKYSNPTGVVYSDETVDRLAAMETAAPDFRIFWDNAYAVHHLTDDPPVLKNLLAACRDAGNEERALLFGSTSKISFAGAGLGFLAAGSANVADAKAHIQKQTIGPDKLNQLRHVRFFRDLDGIREHMQKHAAILRPKFDAVLEILAAELDGTGVAEWSEPQGGYFVSLDVLDGCAQEIVRLAGEAGVKLTKAGATFPYGKDPRDRNIRLAPTLPPLADIRQAMELVTVCVQLVCARALMTRNE